MGQTTTDTDRFTIPKAVPYGGLRILSARRALRLYNDVYDRSKECLSRSRCAVLVVACSTCSQLSAAFDFCTPRLSHELRSVLLLFSSVFMLYNALRQATKRLLRSYPD